MFRHRRSLLSVFIVNIMLLSISGAAFAQSSVTVTNPGSIVINDNAAANPYPSTITVVAVNGTVGMWI